MQGVVQQRMPLVENECTAAHCGFWSINAMYAAC